MLCSAPTGAEHARAQDSFHLKVLQDLRVRAANAPLAFFIYWGAQPSSTFHVMRRRLQRMKHTDCTDRGIFGRRNRYAFAALTLTGTPAVDNKPASMVPESGNSGLFSDVGAGYSNSSCLQVKSVTMYFFGLSRTRFFSIFVISKNIFAVIDKSH